MLTVSTDCQILPVYSMSMAALYQTSITVNFCGAGKNFCGSEAQYSPKTRYATIVVKVYAGQIADWAHTLMIGKGSLKGWWILTTLKKWTGWAQALFRKVVGDRFYSSSVPKYIYFEDKAVLAF